jgi:hypothetical protein
MKKTFTILSFITGIALNVMAQIPGQPIGGIVVKGGKNPGGNALISLSGGITNPSTPTKQNANIAKGYAINANVYVPLFARGGNDNLAGKTDHFFSVGPNAGGEYFGSNKDYETGNFTPYNITGQSSSPGLATRGSGKPTLQGFKAELGVQSNFSFGQVTISPILNAAYLNIKQQAFAITQSSSVNGQNRDFNLYTQAETKTSGFAFVPKLRLAYFPGKLGFFVDGNYTIGPGIKNETATFTPQGVADGKGFYNIDQMLNGSNIATVKTTKYNNLGFNFGVSLGLGKGITEKGIKRSEAQAIKTENPLPTAVNNAENPVSDVAIPQSALEGRKNNKQPCEPIILFPKLGQRFSQKEKINVSVNIPSEYNGEKSIRVYKISDDENFLGKLSPDERSSLNAQTNVDPSANRNAKSSTIVKNLSKSGAEYQSSLDGLEKGTYLAMIGSGTCHAQSVSFVVTSGLHRLDVLIDTAKCKGFNAAGKPIYSISITLKNFSTVAENVTYDFNNAANVAQNAAIPGNILANIVYAGASGTINLTSGVYPPTLAPGAQQTFTIDYTPTNANATCLNLDIYISSQQGSTTINDNTFNCIPVKPCICNYCDNIIWKFGDDKVTATTQLTNNNINVATTITSPNVLIKNFKAELISFIHVSANGTEECFGCNKDSQTFGNFTSGTFTSTAWGVQNGLFPVIPAGGGNTHHTLSWFSLSPPTTQLAGAQINLNISAPPFSTLACCDDVIRFCIRYSFTNSECQTCSFVKCYQVTRKHR